jgi:polygalacturonase
MLLECARGALAAALLVLCAGAAAQPHLIAAASDTPLNINAFGAVAGADTYAAAITNGLALFNAVAAANNGTGGSRTVLVPAGSQYWMLPHAPMIGLTNVTLLLSGDIQAWTSNLTLWPNDTSGSALNLLEIDGSTGVTITGGGNVYGNGYGWWWLTLLALIPDNRPLLLAMNHCAGVTLTNVSWVNSPRYHVYMYDVLNVLIEDVTVYVSIEGEDGQRELLRRFGHLSDGSDGLLPAGIPTFPLNTDGIDVAGRNITIRRVNVTNFDDAICMKPLHAGAGQYSNCTEDVLVEDSVVQLGVGLSVGSVPPNPGTNCIRNVVRAPGRWRADTTTTHA